MTDMADGFDVFFEAYCNGIKPDPALFVDEWAEEFMEIPAGPAAEPGKYRVDRTPYARAIMRALSPSHPAKRVVAKIASQLMKTQVGLNWIGANIHQAPANMLVLLPTDKLAKRVSSRIEKTIQAVPELRDRVSKPRSRDSKNTVDTKEFIGGTLYITTAGSAANLAEVPARYIYGDEIDRWEVSIDGEGNPIELAENRATTFGRNAKFYYTSSPTEEGASAIDDLFKQGDQQRFYVPCPSCGHMHILQQDALRWNEDFTDAWMICPACEFEIRNHHKSTMLPVGEWRQHSSGDGETVSFELPAFYAPIGWVSFLALAKQYDKAKTAMAKGDYESMQVFYNTRLALTWSNKDEVVKSDQLKAAAEDYRLGIVPLNGLILTAAVDTQGNRLEVKINAWGPGLERWVVNTHVIAGDPHEAETWAALDKILTEPVQHEAGKPMIISAVGIDTGGHATQEVYDFCRRRKRRYINGREQRVLAIKGASKAGRPIISSRPSMVDINLRGRIEKHGAMLWMIGTDTAKDWIYNRLLLTSGPGAIHYSKELPDEYFEQMVSEYRKTRYVKGYKRIEWHKDKSVRNEQFDLEVYNLGMAHHLELHKKSDLWWQRQRDQLIPLNGDLFAASAPPAASTQKDEPETLPRQPDTPRRPALPKGVGGGIKRRTW